MVLQLARAACVLGRSAPPNSLGPGACTPEIFGKEQFFFCEYVNFIYHCCLQFFFYCYIQYTILTLLTLLALLTILLPTIFTITYNTYVTRNITYSTIVTYITITNTTNITNTSTRQSFFFPSLSATLFFLNKCLYFNSYKSLARVASHLFLKRANVPFLFAIYFSVSNLISTFLRKILKSG